MVHLNAANLKDRDHKTKENLLFGVGEKELGLMAHTSRLNLALALSSAKRMKKLRFRANLISISACCIGALLAFLSVFFNINEHINEFYILLYWAIGLGGIVALVLTEAASKYRYDFNRFLDEKQIEQQNATMKNNNQRK